MTPWNIVGAAVKVIGIAAAASAIKAWFEQNSRVSELEEENRFLREQLEEQRSENKLRTGAYHKLQTTYEEMAGQYGALKTEHERLEEAQMALTRIPSKEEAPSYEWVDFDDYDEDEHELKYNSANGALYNGGMIANGTMRDLADLLYMEVMGLDYPTTARVNVYPRGSTRETEPEEIRVSIYFDAGDTYGLEEE